MEKQESIDYVVKKFNLDTNSELPIRIPNVERHKTLPELYKELGYKEGVEIGVAEGNFSRSIGRGVPGVKLHCVDAWEYYRGYGDFRRSFFPEAEKTARRILAPYKFNIIKKYSLDAVKDFKDASLDFMYLDCNHDLRHVIDDLTEWVPKIRPGGMVSGHDWYDSQSRWRAIQVIPALIAYTSAWRIKPWFVLGRDEKVEGETRERSRSWFFFV